MVSRLRPNPTGFLPKHYSDRELLVGLLNEALAVTGYTVPSRNDISRIYAGYWQRAAGAARWFATAYSPAGRLELYSHDTMRDCVRYGITLDYNRQVGWWEVIARRKVLTTAS